jgi:hypothetical protein
MQLANLKGLKNLVKSKSLFVLCLLSICSGISAQSSYKNVKRSWHNRKPNAAYWQQDVHYTIDASVNEQENMIDASQQLVYTNNSPDALPFVYFHVYQNAFVQGSYLEQLYHANENKTYHGKRTGAGLGTTVEGVTVDGISCKTELDNTILKVYLPKPLTPNTSATFNMKFKTYWDFGSIRRRMQIYGAWGWAHFNGVHWYPRISVYDKKKGWDTDQHLNKELYGDYGVFDVNLNLPNNYIAEATGQLTNFNDVLPAELYNKLQLKNFANKPWNEKPSEIIAYKKGERKIWKYHAENVHDFAFTADPSYRISYDTIYGVQCVAIVQEPHASRWQNCSGYITKIIKTFSDDFGMYEYPKIVAADANDGMEYPMITLDGGGDPDYRGLLVHEIGHNWFYGMIGNNETYRAALDEGFTQFLTAWGLRKIDGDTEVATPDSRKYVDQHKYKMNVLDENYMLRYTSAACSGDDKPLNTHSNDFNSALAHENGYSNVYFKTATMLTNLQYVLGDTLFQAAMKHYVEKWKFAHPYFEDFRESIIEYTHVDLNWFFDQWLETTKTVDYAVTQFQKQKGTGNYNITLKRQGEMQMPIDLTVTAKDGKKYNYHIPNTNVFTKTTDATVLPHWYGWHILNPSYTFATNIPSGIKTVQIDTTLRLADCDMNNNLLAKGIFSQGSNIERFDFGLRNPPVRTGDVGYSRPDVWWNPIDGIKLGWVYESSYLNLRRKWDMGIWANTHLLTNNKVAAEGFATYEKTRFLDYLIGFETPLVKWNKKMSIGFLLRNIDNASRNTIHLSWTPNPTNYLKLEVTNLSRGYRQNYANYGDEWTSYAGNSTDSTIAENNFVQLYWSNTQRKSKHTTVYQLWARTSVPSLMADYRASNYAYLQGEAVTRKSIKKFDVAIRGFMRLGWGNTVPNESALYLAGANAEQMLENKYTRTAYINNATYNQTQFSNFSNLHAAGGLNLRGYTGYFAVDQDTAGGLVYMGYKGNTGFSGNIEIDFDKYINFKPKFTRNWLRMDTYLFADAGLLRSSPLNLTNVFKIQESNFAGTPRLRADAGLGAALTIKQWGKFEKAKPLTLRVDWPLFVNTLPSGYSYGYVSARRWVIGVNRAF